MFEGVTKPLIDLDVYLEAAFDVLNAGPANRPPMFYMAHLAWRHRKTQAVLFAPLWLQKVLVPAIVARRHDPGPLPRNGLAGLPGSALEAAPLRPVTHSGGQGA